MRRRKIMHSECTNMNHVAAPGTLDHVSWTGP